jgi:hypothetical protein
MRCLQCGKKLNLLRKIASGEFCSAEHREHYRSNESQLALARLKESQVRIERPSHAATMAAMAAVERLRAMDSSDADPVFVETFPFAESVRPSNQRRMSVPVMQPGASNLEAALPDRPEHKESLSFAASGALHGVVESGPLENRGSPSTFTLRPLFRLGVRLLASGHVKRAGQMQRPGLGGLTMPRPILRPGRIRGGALGAPSWVLANQAQPGIPVPVPPDGTGSGNERMPQAPPVPLDGILPSPLNISRPPLLPPLNARLPAPDGQTYRDAVLRAAACSLQLREFTPAVEPVERPVTVPEPAMLQSTQPVGTRTAAGEIAPPVASDLALAHNGITALPVRTIYSAAPLHLGSCQNLEPVGLLPAAAPVFARETVEPVAADFRESLPVMRHAAVSAMRSDETMAPVALRSAAGVSCAREIAANAAVPSMDTALPEPAAMSAPATAMASEARLLPIAEPAAESCKSLPRAIEATPKPSLNASLPAHEAVHTTLPRMREEEGLQPLPCPATAASRPAQTEFRLLAMVAAAAAGSPALPGFAAHPDPIAAQDRPLSNERPFVAGPAPAEEQPSGEPVPPAIVRQLPLAMGRAVSGDAPALHSPAGGSRAIWEASISSAPAEPVTRLTVDHADGSGSRQGRAASSRSRRNFMPALDLRSLPGRKFWRYAPADLKWVALGLPLILVFVVYSFRGSQPKIEAGAVVAATQSATAVTNATSESITDSLKQVLMNRAAVNLLDDFRGGLGAWQGSEGWAKSWRYGQATFLEPGSLAFYKPSMELRDYSLEFLGQIQGRSLNWVFRAKDARNYYVVRIVITRPGPMPEAQIVQYAVIDGKEERHKVLPTPYPVRPDTMYLVRVDVRGSEFNIYLQGQPLYNFSDDRLKEGGIGFFTPKGDKSYLRWVQVKHQYDYIGRLCALLAPYHVSPEAPKSE